MGPSPNLTTKATMFAGATFVQRQVPFETLNQFQQCVQVGLACLVFHATAVVDVRQFGNSVGHLFQPLGYLRIHLVVELAQPLAVGQQLSQAWQDLTLVGVGELATVPFELEGLVQCLFQQSPLRGEVMEDAGGGVVGVETRQILLDDDGGEIQLVRWFPNADRVLPWHVLV